MVIEIEIGLIGKPPGDQKPMIMSFAKAAATSIGPPSVSEI